MPGMRRIGFGDLTDSTLVSAATALLQELQDNGCPPNSDPDVQAFQQAYVNAGGNLPADSGGRSGVDGLYGANTAAALQATINANQNNAALTNMTAPAGCVAAASGGSGGGGGSTSFTNNTSATTMSMVGSIPGGWWTVAAVALVGAALVYEGTSHHGLAGAPRKAAKGIHKAHHRIMHRGHGRRRRRH